eukprot:m51a1_g7741 putative 60S ribosomal protein L29 (124) ;mRNA; r:2636-3191
MVKVKAYELRTKSKADLLKQLDELKTELAQLRVAKVTGGAASRLAKIHTTRKNIARVLTVISQTQRAQLSKFYAHKKFKPLDLRKKKTRALRRKLNRGERMAKTVRALKDRTAFPPRKFALRV